jgi:hypothetical protein
MLRVVDAIVFGAALLLSIGVVISTIAQPLSPGRALAYIVLAPLATIVFHRSVAFLQRRRARRSAQGAGTASRGMGVVKWLGAPVTAILVCGGLEALVQQRGFSVVREDLGPVVQAIEARLSVSERVPDIQDALGAAHELGFVDYFPRERAFVLAARGGSIDMDGETIYYDSQDRKWSRFHNDLAETDAPAAVRFKAATGDVNRIQYSRSGGGWKPYERR